VKIRNKRDVAVAIAPPGSHTGIAAAAGGVIEVDDDLGASLLEQSDRWETVESPSSKKPSGVKE